MRILDRKHTELENISVVLYIALKFSQVLESMCKILEGWMSALDMEDVMFVKQVI